MTLRVTQLIPFAVLALAQVACGSKDSDPGESGGESGEEENPPVTPHECTPEEADVVGNHCFPGMADPCANPISTDYPGDEYCLQPPEAGFQLHVGPSSYDDPDELARWVLPPGGYTPDDPRFNTIGGGPDVNWCFYQKTPNAEDVFIKESFSRMRPGSHHYIAFALPSGADLPDSTEPSSCGARNGQAAGGANFLSGATRAVQNVAMFGDAPEDEGLGSLVEGRTQMNQNLHFVNVGDEPVLQELWVNMIEIPADEVTSRVRALTWYGGLGMDIPYGAHELVESTACSAPTDIPEVRLLGATAHAHANTLRVSVHRLVDGKKEPVFHDFDWDEPTVWRWNSVMENPAPDMAAAKSGAVVNGTFLVHPGDQFSWECEVVNKSPDMNNLVFSDRAYSGEMCNVFGMYSAPTAVRPWTCFSLTGGKPVAN